MRIGRYQFSPKIIPTLATLVLLPVFIALGFWQLGRAEEKQQILDLNNKRQTMPVLELDRIPEDLSELEFRKLSISGRYLNDYQIYVDNKRFDGRIGYQIVTPLRLNNSDFVILVNRGWLASTGNREILPKIPQMTGQVQLTGTIKVRTRDIASIHDHNRLGEDWPALVLWPDPISLNKDIPGNVAPFVFLQDELPQDEFKRKWVLVSSLPEKSISYAVQWFSFAALLMIIYIIVNIKRINK